MNKRYKRGLSVLLSLVLCIGGTFEYGSTHMTSYAYTERSARVNASTLNVRSGPGTTYSIVTKLSNNTSVTVINEKTASDGALWYQIRFSGTGGAETTGYASKAYIRFPTAYSSDASFEAYMNAEGFPESYREPLRELHAMHPTWVFTAQKTNLDWNTVISNESVVGRNLVYKTSISSWKSIADGAYNWETSIWPGFDSSSWVAASEDIIRHYMDPRNFLDEKYVFQFLRQSYDSSVHNAEGLNTMLSGTFLASTAASAGVSGGGTTSGASGYGPGVTSSSTGNTASGSTGVVTGVGPGQSLSESGSTDSTSETTSSGTSVDFSAPTRGSDSGVSLIAPQASISKKETDVLASNYGPGVVGSGTSSSSSAPLSGSSSYAEIIMNAGIQSGVNPYVLAAMVIQEQGANGTSGLISGTTSGYEGYYNFFNIEAYQTDSMTAVQRGLWYASQSGSYQRPWNSVEKSILGGAIYYGENYVKVGQNTFYLKKFNVQGSNLYKHQYMTNIQGAASEGYRLAEAYSDALKQTALEFQIPVYDGMPDTASAKPTVDGSPNNKLAGLGVNGFSLTPTFNRDTASYDLIVNPSVSTVTVNATAIDSTATVSGAGNINIQSGDNKIWITVKAQNGTVREYVINVVRQDNGPTGDGSINTGITGSSSGGNTGPGVAGPGVSAQSSAETPTAEAVEPGGGKATVIPVS